MNHFALAEGRPFTTANFLIDQYELRHRFPGGVIIPKVNIGAIEGGLPIKPNYSAGICYAYVDVRIPPGVKPLAAFREVEQVAAEAGVPVELEMYLSQPGCVSGLGSSGPGLTAPGI